VLRTRSIGSTTFSRKRNPGCVSSHILSLMVGVFYSALSLLVAIPLGVKAQIPSLHGSTSLVPTGDSFHLTSLVRIFVDTKSAHEGDPSLLDFARTFQRDLASVTGWPIAPVQLATSHQVTSPNPSVPSVYLSLKAKLNFTYLSGVPTDEGYEYEITKRRYAIRGVAPIGVWWGTRTLLQQAALAQQRGPGITSIRIPSGGGTDTPGWEVRGAMLDVGRHFFTTAFLGEYTPEAVSTADTFLGELCAYASFFKISSLHLHASDNLWDQRFLYGKDRRKLYTGFRFRPGSSSPNSGLIPPEARNQTWTRAEFEALQTSCSMRGVSLVPEIDSPGHSLVFTKWKPQLAMSGAPDNLNLSHPETIPTLQSVWHEFLPWFSKSSEVHIGADEYDRAYASVYNGYVNDMASYIRAESGKKVRVWGTGMPPASDSSTISTDVTIQHWNFPDTIPVRLLDQGYRVINSEQAFLYTDGKTSYDYGAQFPLELRPELFWPEDPSKPAWQPNVFSFDDASNNTDPGHPQLCGAIMALWNDWGNNATTPLEIYGQLSRSLAMLGERTWAGAGHLDRATFERDQPKLSAAAPGQNLDRREGLKPGQTVVRFPGPVPNNTPHSAQPRPLAHLTPSAFQ